MMQEESTSSGMQAGHTPVKSSTFTLDLPDQLPQILRLSLTATNCPQLFPPPNLPFLILANQSAERSFLLPSLSMLLALAIAAPAAWLGWKVLTLLPTGILGLTMPASIFAAVKVTLPSLLLSALLL